MSECLEMIQCHIEAAVKTMSPDAMRILADELEDIVEGLRIDAYEKERDPPTEEAS